MSISRKYINKQLSNINFNTADLARLIKKDLSIVDFCFILGSSVDGVIRKNSDLDLALYLNKKADYELYSRVFEIVEKCASGAVCDIGVLNNAEPVYCFEAIRGRLLFTRNLEKYLRFYSLTCRLYESQMISYERQLQYRRECRDAL